MARRSGDFISFGEIDGRDLPAPMRVPLEVARDLKNFLMSSIGWLFFTLLMLYAVAPYLVNQGMTIINQKVAENATLSYVNLTGSVFPDVTPDSLKFMTLTQDSNGNYVINMNYGVYGATSLFSVLMSLINIFALAVLFYVFKKNIAERTNIARYIKAVFVIQLVSIMVLVSGAIVGGMLIMGSAGAQGASLAIASVKTAINIVNAIIGIFGSLLNTIIGLLQVVLLVEIIRGVFGENVLAFGRTQGTQ